MGKEDSGLARNGRAQGASFRAGRKRRVKIVVFTTKNWMRLPQEEFHGVGLLHRGRQKKRAGEQGAADEAGDLEAFAGLDAALAFSRLTRLVSRRLAGGRGLL